MHNVGDFIVEGIIKRGTVPELEMNAYLGVDLEISQDTKLHLLGDPLNISKEIFRENQTRTLYGEVLVDHDNGRFFLKILNSKSQVNNTVEYVVR